MPRFPLRLRWPVLGLLVLMLPGLAAAAVTVTSIPSPCPGTALVGGVYNGGNVCQFVASGGGTPYTWSISLGSIPTGMSFDTQFGYVGGTPNTAGTFNFTVKATDATGTPGTLAVTIVVSNPQPLVITTTSFSQAEAGAFFFQSASASGGVAPYTWAFQPAFQQTGFNGISTTAGGDFQGYPNAGGSFSVPIQVTDSASTSVTTQASIPWNVFSGITVLPAQTTLTTVTTNTFGTFTFTANGGNGGPYTWAFGGAGDSAPTRAPRPTGSAAPQDSPLAVVRRAITPRATPPPRPIRRGKTLGNCFTPPIEMSVNASTGVLSGTPTTPCYYSVAVQAADGIGVGQSFVTLPVADPLVITNTSLPGVVVNQAYDPLSTFSFTSTGGDDSPVWGATNLPGGISVNGSALKGTPTVAGIYNVTISATPAPITVVLNWTSGLKK